MPSKKTKAALPPIPKELIDQFVTGPMSAEAVNAASMAFKKALIERALGAECGVGGRGELAALGAETVGSLVKSQWRYSRGLTLRLRQEPMMEKKVAA